MEILKNNLENEINIRTEMDFPKEGVEFVDITPLILEKEVFNEIIDKLCDEIKDKNIDYVVGPEARGFLFGSAVANKLNIGFIPIRKRGKLPPSTVEASFTYEKEYGEDYLELPKLVGENYSDKRFYIIDDIYATGNTLKAIEKTISDLGGLIIGKGVVINIKGLNNDEVFSLIDINES